MLNLDSSQSPIFLWDFRDSNASIELPPSLFVRVSSIEAYESRKSHGKIGDCEQSMLNLNYGSKNGIPLK